MPRQQPKAFFLMRKMFNRHIILLVTGIVLMNNIAFSQDAVITGRIKYGSELLQGVTISLGNKIITSDQDGSFTLSVKPGTYTISITHAGYIKIEQVIIAEAGRTKNIDFELTLNDQLEEVTKVGSLKGLLDSMPGFSGMVKEDQLDQVEGRMEKWRYIIQSMNKEEKADPDLLNASRIKRIARGSGWPEHEVKELVKNYNNSKNMMKASKGRQMQGALRRMGLG